VAFPAFELLDCREGRIRPGHEFGGVDELEIVSRKRGEQAEADICGRGAMRDDHFRADLHVVRGKAVVVSADKSAEIGPGLPRDLQQIGAIRRRERRARPRDGAAQDKRNPGRRDPRSEDGYRDRQRVGTNEANHPKRCNREQRTGHHPGQEQVYVHGSAACRTGGRGLPLQEAPARDDEAHQCDPDRVQPLVRFVRHEGELQAAAGEIGLEILEGGAAEHGERLPLSRPSQHFGDARQTWKRQRRKAGNGPAGRVPGQNGPAEDQQQQRSRRQQAPPEVVEDLPARDERQPIALHPGA
jgi:hypothetical protein